MPEKLTQGPRITADLSAVGAVLARGPNRRNKLRFVSAFSPSLLFQAGEVGAWYDPSDLTTLFQDAAGTSPVTTPGQTVALMLDKSRTQTFVARRNLLVQSQSIQSSPWVGFFVSGSSSTVVSPDGVTFAAAITGPGDTGTSWSQTYSSAPIGTYTFSLWLRADSSFSTSMSIGSTTITINVNTSWQRFVATTTTSSVANLVASFRPSTTGGVTRTVYAWGAQLETGSVATDYQATGAIYPTAWLGNHATQATAAQRPTYGIEPMTGRRNILLWTEDFTNAYWTKTNITLTSGVTDPNGGTSAFTYTASAANGTVSRSVGSLAAGSAISFWIRRRTGTGAVAMWDGNSYNDVTVTGSWARVQINQELLTTGFWDMRLAVSGDAVDVAFPQVETGSVATAYQRVTTQFDVTEAGVASKSYLFFDGVDDGMLTGTITPGVDKAQVFAGFRKLSDAAASLMLLEYSPDAGSNAGSFWARASLSPPDGGYISTSSRGSAALSANQQVAATSVVYSAPVTVVFASTHDISGNLTTLKLNAVSIGSATGNKGTGNFLAYPLYIGRRGGTSLPFSGQIYSLITRFSSTNLDASTIASTEAWMNAKTGAY